MMGAPTGDPHVVKHVLLFFVASAGCAVAYMVTCWWRPYAACIWCKGKRIYRSSSGRTWRRCPICKGTGERLRVGRVLWNWWRKGRGTR